MMRLNRFFLLLALLALGGCGRESSYRAVVRDQTGAYAEMTSILKAVNDEASMTAAREKLQDRKKDFDAISSRAKSLPRPDKEMADRLGDDIARMNTALQNFRAEVQRVQGLPGGAEFIKNVGID